jgi:hypothetical protein
LSYYFERQSLPEIGVFYKVERLRLSLVTPDHWLMVSAALEEYLAAHGDGEVNKDGSGRFVLVLKAFCVDF